VLRAGTAASKSPPLSLLKILIFARVKQPHGIWQCRCLCNDNLLVPEIQTGAVFKLDGATAGTWAYDYDLTPPEVWSTGFGKGSGAVCRANGIYDISPIQCRFYLVSGGRHRLKSFKYAFTVYAALVPDGFNIFRELFNGLSHLTVG